MCCPRSAGREKHRLSYVHSGTNTSQLCSTPLLLPGSAAQITWQQPWHSVPGPNAKVVVCKAQKPKARPCTAQRACGEPGGDGTSPDTRRCPGGPGTVPEEPSAWLSLGCPAATFAPGRVHSDCPRGSGLDPIPRPTKENSSPGSHRAVRGCGHIKIRRGAGQALHPSSQTGVESIAALPQAIRTHAPQQWTHAGARAPPGKAEGTWRAQCQGDFTLSTPAVPHTCLFLPAQGLPLFAEI